MKQLLLGVMVCALALAGTTFAQVENWDGATPGTSGCTTTGTGLPYNGWTNDPGDINTSFRVWTGSTSSFNTGPTGDLCGAGNYVYLETSCGANPNIGTLISPVFDATGVTTPTLSFYYHMFGAAMGTLEVEESDGMGGWTNIFTLSGDQGNQWVRVDLAVTTYAGAMGPEAQFRFRGTRGTSFTSDICLDVIEFGDPNPAAAPIHQANSGAATLQLDGIVCQDFTMGMCPFVAPLQASYDNGALMNWTVSSAANGQQPYALFHTPGFGAMTAGPGFPTIAGIVDFSVAGFAALDILIDGIAGTEVIDQLLGDTTTSGTRTLQFTMPAGAANSNLTTAQALMVDPSSMFGVTVSAATQVDRLAAGAGSLPNLPPAFTGGTPFAGLTDDNTVNYVFANGFSFPFYGATYTDIWVNSNGSCSFGLGGDTDLSESIFDLENEEARIAFWWDDLNPPAGGSVDFTETATNFVLSFTDVPEFSATGANNAGISLDTLGNVQIAYAGLTGNDALVGIGPGNNSPGGLPNPGVSMDLTAAAPGSIIGTANDSIFHLFTTNPGYGISVDPCVGLVMGTTLLNFIPNPPTAVAGDAGYTAP